MTKEAMPGRAYLAKSLPIGSAARLSVDLIVFSIGM